MSSRSWSEFRINFSQNTAWDLSREHWWDLINSEFILFWSSLIVHLSKTAKYLLCPSKWKVKFTVMEVVFFLFQRKLYILFSIFFLIFWHSINLAYIPPLGNEDLVSDYIFTSEKKSRSHFRYRFFANFNYFFPFRFIDNRFTKINFRDFNKNCDYSSCPGWWILFLCAPPYKGLAFWKIIFELVCRFHIVLKSLVS